MIGNIHPAWKNAIGGFMIHMVLGSLYLWGNLTPVVTSYLRKYDGDLTYNDTIFVYITALLFNGISMLCQGYIETVIGARGCVFLGGYLVVLASILSSCATSIEFLVLTEGVMFGCGFGIAYTVPFSCAAKWLPSRKGLLTGIVISGIGVGAAVFSAVAMYYANPRGLSPASSGSTNGYYPASHEVPAAVPQMYLFLGCVYFIFVTVGGLCIHPHSESDMLEYERMAKLSRSREESMSSRFALQSQEETDSLLPSDASSSASLPPTKLVKRFLSGSGLSDEDGHRLLPTIADGSAGKVDDIESVATIPNDKMKSENAEILESGGARVPLIDLNTSPMEMLFTRDLYHIVACFFLTTAGGLYMAGVFRTFGEAHFRDDDVFLTTVGSFASLSNTLGRVGWGTIGDKYGCAQTLIAMNVIFAFAFGTYPMSFTFGKSGYFLWTCALFCFEGGNFSLFPPLVMQIFGSKHSGANYGIVFALVNSSTVIAIAIVSKFALPLSMLCKGLGMVTLIGVSAIIFLQKSPHVTIKKT